MKSVSLILSIFVVLILVVSCSVEDHEIATSEGKLIQAFEAEWGKPVPPNDTIRLALAALPGRNAHILYCRAWKLANEKRLAEAVKTADSLVLGYPRFEKGLFLRAGLRLENGDTSGSLNDFERCLKRNPSFFECRMNRGALFFARRMPDLAYQDFREALRLRPGNADAQLNMGNAFAALGQRDSACFYWLEARRNGSSEVEKLPTEFCEEAKK